MDCEQSTYTYPRVHFPNHAGGSVEFRQFNSTRLQERRLSSSVEVNWFEQLVLAGPVLRALEWKWTHKSFWMMKGVDFRKLFQQRRLRYLDLDGWRLSSVYLNHILANNANHLQEISLRQSCGWG
ncbi:hypothetical protein BKA57DRAFT_539150 [Linnemannia elongata]|nr:hypothetical protein BKA57DRAFT_539150 [Linnemannia elongata]